MSEVDQSYRKKQAFLMILVFACIGVAIWNGNPFVTVGSILVACGICFWASTMEPAKSPEEHQHH
jgi:hypothetical protein